MRRKIYIPFNTKKNIGGPATFMRNLKTELDKLGYKYLSKPSLFSNKKPGINCGGIFFPISYNRKTLKKFKDKDRKIIQRLDGVYATGSEKNIPIKDIYLNYSDFIVFQSEYSRKQCFERLGQKQKSEYAIILNGVRKDIFYPVKNKSIKLPDKITFITHGNFRREDMIKPLVETLDLLKSKVDFQFTVIGPIDDKCKRYLNRDYINYLGSMDVYKIAEHLRKADIYLFASRNPPCPNALLEAVSCGLPIVTFEDGSTPEILHFNKDLLAFINNDLFKKGEDLEAPLLLPKIEECINNYPKHLQKAHDNSNLYDMKKTAKSYTEVFDKVLKG